MLGVVISPGHPIPLLQEVNALINKTNTKAAATVFKTDFFIVNKISS